jgi:hypothetical protein
MGLAAAGGLLYYFRKEAREAANNTAKSVTDSAANLFAYKFAGFGQPSISNQVLTLPTKILLTNKSGLTFPIQKLDIDLSYKRGSTFIKAGKLTQQNIVIEPGEKAITLNPKLDLQALFKDFLKTADSILSNKSVDIKADVTITVAGVTVTDTLFHQIPIRL